jgi:cell division protease FtsH
MPAPEAVPATIELPAADLPAAAPIQDVSSIESIQGLPSLDQALPASKAAPALRLIVGAPGSARREAANDNGRTTERLESLRSRVSGKDAAPAAALEIAFDRVSSRRSEAAEAQPETAVVPETAPIGRVPARSIRSQAAKFVVAAAAVASPAALGFDRHAEHPWIGLGIGAAIFIPFVIAIYRDYQKMLESERAYDRAIASRNDDQTGGAPERPMEEAEPAAKKAPPAGAKTAAVDADGRKVTFDDIAGQEEAKLEFKKVLDFLKDPEKYRKKGADGYKGILLYGPPGTGKTEMARALANESGVPFKHMSGSEFIQEYVGVGAKRVRKAFAELRAQGGGIFFIDEFDALGGKRQEQARGGDREHDQTLNQVLTEMDGFKKDNIIVIAATNRLEAIDPALLRGRRFGLKVPMGLPDVDGRLAILKVHTRKARENRQLAKDVDLKELAKDTPGLGGADLKEIVNIAAMEAAFRNASKIEMSDFRRAVDLQANASEVKRRISPAERKVLAFHEAGHALVARFVPHGDRVRKISIIPNGNGAAGYMQTMAEEERMMYSRSWLTDRMAVALGGRAAELLKTGDSYTGASNDLEVARDIARRMVTKWGMSDKMGMMAYETEGGKAGNALSQRTQRRIDAEVEKLVKEAYDKAVRILTEQDAALQAVAKALLEKETLRGEDFEEVVERNSAAARRAA